MVRNLPQRMRWDPAAICRAVQGVGSKDQKGDVEVEVCSQKPGANPCLLCVVFAWEEMLREI